MIVCSCNVIRCHDVRAVAADGTVVRVSEVYARLGCTAQCGRCAGELRAILVETLVACAQQCGSCARFDMPCALAVPAGRAASGAVLAGPAMVAAQPETA